MLNSSNSLHVSSLLGNHTKCSLPKIVLKACIRRNIILLASGSNILHLDICDILSFFMTHVRESLSMTRLQETLLHYFTLKVMKYGVFSSLYSLLQSLKKMSTHCCSDWFVSPIYFQMNWVWRESSRCGKSKKYHWISFQKKENLPLD